MNTVGGDKNLITQIAFWSWSSFWHIAMSRFPGEGSVPCNLERVLIDHYPPRTIEPSTPGMPYPLMQGSRFWIWSALLAGTYRIRYYGDAKPFFGRIYSFTGTSSSFTIS